MEKYENNNNYQIVSISRSNDPLKILTDQVPSEVKFSFLPYLTIDEKDKIVTSTLSSQFIQTDNSPLTNELIVRVSFMFAKSLPILKDGADKVKIQSYKDLLSIFDTAIGTFRGILFEWLKGSSLQQPLPPVDVEEFMKGLRISFSK